MQNSPDAVQRGIRLGVVAYLLWGFLTIYWKQLTAFDAIELIGWRVSCAAALMAVVVTIRGTWSNIRAAFRDGRTVRRLAIAGTLLAVNWFSYVWGVLDGRVIETALGYFIAPLATMAIGVFVLGEVPTSAQRVAFGLAALSVVTLTIAAGRPPWISFAIAGSWSLYALAKRQVDLDAIDGMAGELLVLLVPASVVLLALSGRTGSVIDTAGGREWALVLGTGAITALPLTLFASAARTIPFTLLGPLNLIVPVIGFGLGWLLYDEDVTVLRFVGFAFVWCALVVVMYDRIVVARRPPVGVPADAPL